MRRRRRARSDVGLSRAGDGAGALDAAPEGRPSPAGARFVTHGRHAAPSGILARHRPLSWAQMGVRRHHRSGAQQAAPVAERTAELPRRGWGARGFGAPQLTPREG